MPQKIFIENVDGENLTLDEEQSRHIAKSLRMHAGDMIVVCDGKGVDYGCMIESVGNPVTLKVCYRQASGSEPNVRVHIYQGVPKGDKMESIIQKCTELGVAEITPVLTKRSVSRPDEARAKKKNARYQKIAHEAAEQSGRGTVPKINEMISFEKALSSCTAPLKILFYEGGGDSLKTILKNDEKEIAVFIGPEGGFEKEEATAVLNAGGVLATLGPRILRTETAPVVALSAIMLLTGNLE